jgi:hypothetical protein
MYDEEDGSIWKFATTPCNLQATNNISTWWKPARKWIPTNLSWLHNNKSMGIKWDFLGMYCSILRLNHQHMSNIYGFSSNDDWSAQNSKITKAKHRDVIVNRLFDAVKKNINKANKAFIKTCLGAWKANIKDAIQGRKRKHPRNQKHESNC